jgi:hypothetical protein
MIGAWAIGMVAGRAWCDPPAASTAASKKIPSDTLRGYRRIFVPADRVDIWPREGRKYIPVEEKDFEAWLAASNNSETTQPSIAIDEATYEGSLNDADQLVGHGAWKISIHGKGSAFLGLPGKTLAIRNVRWKDYAEEPVRIGSWGTTNGSPSEFGLVVAHSGWLEFDWSIRRQLKDNAFDVPWDVPAALSTRLTLQLPEGQVPSFDDGAILESTALAQNRSLANASATQRRWVLTYGPAPGSRVLHVSNAAGAHIGQPERLELRGKVNYRVEQRGVEIQAEWKLEGQYSAQRELALPLPAGLQLLSVAAEGQELSWRMVRNASPQADQAMISLPRDSENRLLDLKVGLWQPIMFDQPWQLPSTWPENVFWRAMEMVLSVAPELEVRRLDPVDCQQMGVMHLGEDATEPEVFSFAAFAPTSVLRVVLSRREADIRVRTGTSLALTDPDIIGKHIARWSVSRGQVHRLSGTLGRGWTVETVETVPADAVAEWFIERQDDHRSLEIRLTDAITPAREVSVIVTGRLQRFNTAEPMSADMLHLVDWDAARVTRQLLSFQSTEPHVVETSGGATAALPETLDEGDRALLDETAEKAGIFDLANASKGASVRLVTKRGQYSAEIEYEAEWSGEALKHSWEIVAQPRSNAIDRLLIYSTAPLGSSARWSEKATDLPISAELLAADDPLRKNLPREGEVWLLRLPNPSSKPVAISLSIVSSLSHGVTVPILALPEAVDQNGRVTVRAPSSVMPMVVATGLQLLPLPLEKDQSIGRIQLPARLTCRYSPQDCFAPSRAPRLEIGGTAKTGTPLLTIRKLSVETFCELGGLTRHRVTYALQNLGAAEFKTTLPKDVQVTAAYVDGMPIPPAGDKSAAISIPLPSRLSSPVVRIFLETSAPGSGGVFSTIAPPVTQDLYPVLASEWRTWLPESLSISEDDNFAGSFDWRRRIFGLLAPEQHSRSLESRNFVGWENIGSGIEPHGDSDATNQNAAILEESASPLTGTLFSIPVPSATAISLVPIWTIAYQGDDSPAAKSGSELLGWHSVVHHFVGSGPQGAMAVSRPATIKSWAVACLLISFLFNHAFHLGWRIRILEIVFACCLALVLPMSVAPLAASWVWGTVLSQIWTWFARASKVALPKESGAPLPAPAIFMLVLLTLSGKCVLAAEAGTQPASHNEGETPLTPIERVLIPVDVQRKPVGTKVFLSEEFLRDLLGSLQGSTSSDHSWLVSEATYSGELTATHRKSEFSVGIWTLAFTMETSIRQTVIQLPLVRDEAVWQPTAMVDGVPQPISWARDGRSCRVMIPEPGRYVLSLFCSPKIEREDGRGQLRLSIPKLPVAKLALQLPPSLSGVQISNVILAQPSKDRAGWVAGELFHSDRINLSWNLTDSKEVASQRTNISEMDWLNISERGIELTTKFFVEGGSRKPDSLTIRYDDRWNLLTDGLQIAKDVRPLKAGNLQSLQLPLPSVGADRPEVVVRWQLKSRPELGSIRIAPLAVFPTPITQRWFAVSAEPAYDCALLDNSIATTTIKELHTKWGNNAELPTPQIALANVPNDALLDISIRPHEQTSSIREVLHIAAGIPSTRVLYQADVASGSTNSFQFRLNVSPTIEIDRITLISGDQQVPIRWNRNAGTRITVFFSTPVKGDYRLTVDGRIPNNENLSLTIPRISALQNGAVSQTIQLYRDDNVNLNLQGFPEPNGAKTGVSIAPPIEWLVRPVGAFTLDETAFQTSRMVVEANRPVVQGNSLTQLSSKDGKWSVDLRARLKVEQGNLDLLHLGIPASCLGPFQIEGSVPLTTDSTIKEGDRQLLAVRLGTSVAKGKEFTLRLRASLVSPIGDAFAVPEIQISPFEGRRLICVPKVLNTQSLGWTSEGVKPVELSSEWQKEIPDEAAMVFFEATNTSSYKVELQSQTVRQSIPRIHLAETHVILDDNGGRLLVSRFAVLPDGITQCIVSLPANQQLLSIALDGQPALVVPTNSSDWKVTLHSASLPQMLAIVSRVADVSASNQGVLERPTLRTENGMFATDISLWSLMWAGGPRQVLAGEATSVSSIDYAALRFERLVSLAEKARPAAGGIPRANAARWWAEWDSILRETQSAALQTRNASASVSTIAQQSYSAEEQIQLASKRLEVLSGDYAVDKNLDLAVPLHSISWSQLTGHVSDSTEIGRRNESSSNYIFDGERNSLSFEIHGSAARSLTMRFLAVVLVFAVSALLIWLLSNSATVDFVYRWPYALAILGGIFYWTFLWPSWLGLLVVVGSLWLGLRTTWPGRAMRPEASTVLRSTRTLPSK